MTSPGQAILDGRQRARAEMEEALRQAQEMEVEVARLRRAARAMRQAGRRLALERDLATSQPGGCDRADALGEAAALVRWALAGAGDPPGGDGPPSLGAALPVVLAWLEREAADARASQHEHRWSALAHQGGLGTGEEIDAWLDEGERISRRLSAATVALTSLRRAAGVLGAEEAAHG